MIDRHRTSGRPSLGAGLTEAKPRRRWPRVLLWIVAVALLADAVGFAVFAWRYQPLTGNRAAFGVDERAVSTAFTAIAPDGTRFMQFHLASGKRGTFSYAFTLSNTGLLPVTVTSITSRLAGVEATGPLQQLRVRTGEDGTPLDDWDVAAPVEAFSLDGNGGSRFVIVDARFTGCDRTHGPAAAFGSVDVGYRVLGLINRRTTVELPYTIVIPRDAACPRRSRSEREAS